MFTSIAASSPTSIGSVSPPGCIAISISNSTTSPSTSTSSSWEPPEGTPADVLQAMENPDIIENVTHPVGHRDYMKFIMFKKDDSLLPPDEYAQIKATKIEMVNLQKIIEGRSRFNNPTCLKVRLVAILVFGILFVVLFSLPESIFSQDPQASLPVLSSGKGLSLGGTIVGVVKTYRQAIRKWEAGQKLETITDEINQIVKKKKDWVEAKAHQCLIDYVERTPCYGHPQMLRKLIARGILSKQSEIIAAAKNLLMQKTIDIHWEMSQGLLKSHLLEIIPNERMVNRILRPLVDAVLLIKQENSMDLAGSGLAGLRGRANSLAGNTMMHFLSIARDIQNRTFEKRLNPPATDLYGAHLPPIQRGISPKKEGLERKERAASVAKKPPLPRKVSTKT